MGRKEFESFDLDSYVEEMDEETMELLRENDEITKPTLQLASLERREMLARIAAKGAQMQPPTASAYSDEDETVENFEEETAKEEEMEEVLAAAPVVDNVIDLKAIRKKLGLNQIAFSRKLGISQGLVSQVESGRTPVSGKLETKLRKMKLVA